MTILADLPVDPNVIVVLVAVIFAAIKAYLERNEKPGAEEDGDFPPVEGRAERSDFDDSAYEDQLRRQREEREMPAPVVTPRTQTEPSPVRTAARSQAPVNPPPLPGAVPEIGRKRPLLSEAEKKALANLKRRSQQETKPKTRPLTTRNRVVRHLSSPTAAREALVLAEILGPPKALSKFEI